MFGEYWADLLDVGGFGRMILSTMEKICLYWTGRFARQAARGIIRSLLSCAELRMIIHMKSAKHSLSVLIQRHFYTRSRALSTSQDDAHLQESSA